MLRLVPLTYKSIVFILLIFFSNFILAQDSIVPKDWGSEESGKEIIERAKKTFEGMENRYLGSVGNEKMSEWIEKEFKSIVGEAKSGFIEYRQPVFLPGEFHLKIKDQSIKIHCLEPNLIEVSNPRKDVFIDKLVYAGKGLEADIDGKNLKNSIVLMDMGCRLNWQDLVPFGAEAFIFIDDENMTSGETNLKISNAPISIPRYFIKKADLPLLKEHMGENFEKSVPASLEMLKASVWEDRKNIRSHFALVEGKNTERIMVVGVNYDTNGFVPELSVNSSDNINLLLFMDMLKSYAAKQPEISILFTAFNSQYRNNFGAKEFFWYANAEETGFIKNELDYYESKKKFYETVAQKYSEYNNDTIEEMRYGTTEVNGRNYTWKKAIIDLLRGKMNTASERILIITYQMKRIGIENSEILDEKKSYSGEDAYQFDILRNKAVSTPDTIGEIDAVQNELINVDVEVADKCREVAEIEKKILSLSRNFEYNESKDKKIEELTEQKLVLIENLKEKYLVRTKINKDYQALIRNKDLQGNDKLQNQLLKNNQDYLRLQLELFEFKQDKSDAITIQKLYNSKFAEQLFIEEKAGEKRKLLPEKYKPILEKYYKQIAKRNLVYSQAAGEEYELIKKNLKTRELFLNNKGECKFVFFIDFALTYGTNELGLFSDLTPTPDTLPTDIYGRGDYGKFNKAVNFTDTVLSLTKNYCEKNGYHSNLLVDTTLTTSFNKFVIRGASSPNPVAKTFGIPALSLVTLYDRHNINNTPYHDYEKLQTKSVSDIYHYTFMLVNQLVNESVEVKKDFSIYDRGYSHYIFDFVQQDNLAISVPETPVANVLMIFSGQNVNPAAGKSAKILYADGHFLFDICMSSELGAVSVRSIRKKSYYGVQAFQFDKNYEKIINVMDYNKGAKTFKVDLKDVTADYKNYTIPVFQCEQIDLYHNFDYSKLEPHPVLKVLDGLQNSMPQNISVFGLPIVGVHSWIRSPRTRGAFSVFIKKGTTVKLIFDDKILINAAGFDSRKNANGFGYDNSSINRQSIAWNSVKDVHNLNSYRRNLLSSKGVKDSLVEVLHNRSTDYLNEAKSARSKNNFTKFSQKLFFSYGMAYAAYPKILSVMNDMIKAVVFYLALVIPFSFFMQRLVFPVTTIEKQLGLNVLVFFATFMVFRYVHPAFELTDAPIVVLIAFVQIVLALFVFNVLYNKFDSRIKSIQGRSGGGESAGSNILSQALVIGVNNMRKRKIRTLLTCFTIILVTFTMLSFTSISSTVDPTMVRNQAKPTYTGIFYSKNGWSSIQDEIFLSAFPNHSSHVKRAWFRRGGFGGTDTPFVFKEVGTKKELEIEKLLGLEKNEDGFLGKIPISSGRYFSSDEASELLLSRELAEILGIDLNDFKERRFTILGEEFKLVGLYDPVKMNELVDIRGVSIVPQVTIGKPITGSALDELNESDEDDNKNFRPMNSKVMAILPFKKMKTIGGATVSVSLKYDNPDDMWVDAKNFTTFSKENLYISSTKPFKNNKFNPNTKKFEYLEDAPLIKEGCFFIGSGFSTSIGGLTDLIIPLIISATIIMNTMLGAVYERKKEIEIYTSVGLNPTQIGFFFIAESLVYGIIGSVAGYLIGQLVTKVINKFNLLDIDLNFSSLLVVYVMVLTIVIVVVSTIYPAFTAVKAAQPGGETLEKADQSSSDGVMEVLFPFSYTEFNRYAVNGFLREYFLKFSDASTGSFMSKVGESLVDLHYDQSSDFTTEGALVQNFNIALTPYDLGVTQEISLVTFYHPKVNAFMVKMVITRVSGTDSNWQRTNKPFSDEIRKLLLRWRVEPKSVHDKCQLIGEELFSSKKEAELV